MGTPHIGMGRDMSIFQIGESPYQYGVHSNLGTNIYTDASTLQLGPVITQDNRPIAFFSRKLSETQTRYTVTKIELLAIVETLKEFKGMLCGQIIKVYTDHKNLTRDALGLTSDRVHRWRLLLEEYAPEIVYIKGTHNTVADAISRLEYNPKLNSTNEYNHAMQGVSTKDLAHQKWNTLKTLARVQ
jgi:TusA-related sulfurtransferase